MARGMAVKMTNDDGNYWQLIATPAGVDQSGRIRYAAAMHFYQSGQMSAEVLEFYRICSRLDHEDAATGIAGLAGGRQWLEKLRQSQPA